MSIKIEELINVKYLQCFKSILCLNQSFTSPLIIFLLMIKKGGDKYKNFNIPTTEEYPSLFF